MAGVLQGVAVAGAFGVGIFLLARILSPAAAVMNVGIVLVLALVLVLQGLLDSPVLGYAALLLAFVSFALRWAINAVLWLHRRRRSRSRPGDRASLAQPEKRPRLGW